jgi:hypothetical protein
MTWTKNLHHLHRWLIVPTAYRLVVRIRSSRHHNANHFKSVLTTLILTSVGICFHAEAYGVTATASQQHAIVWRNNGFDIFQESINKYDYEKYWTWPTTLHLKDKWRLINTEMGVIDSKSSLPLKWGQMNYNSLEFWRRKTKMYGDFAYDSKFVRVVRTQTRDSDKFTIWSWNYQSCHSCV